MSRTKWFFSILLVALLLAGCSAPVETPVETESVAALVEAEAAPEVGSMEIVDPGAPKRPGDGPSCR